MLQSETTWRRLGTIWIGLCLLLVAVLAWQLPHSRINTSLMDLLPHESRSDLDPALQQGLLQQLDRQLVWMLSLPAGQNGQAAAELCPGLRVALWPEVAAGAAEVVAVDVGYGQLDARLRTDPRVVNREKCNARYLDASDFDAILDRMVPYFAAGFYALAGRD